MCRSRPRTSATSTRCTTSSTSSGATSAGMSAWPSARMWCASARPPTRRRLRSAFARQLDARYQARMVQTDLYRNDLVPHPGLAAPAGPRRQSGSIPLPACQGPQARVSRWTRTAIKRLEDVSRNVVAALERYGPRVLRLVERRGIIFSEPMEMLQRLISGEHVEMPLVQGPDRLGALPCAADFRAGGDRDPRTRLKPLRRHASPSRSTRPRPGREC